MREFFKECNLSNEFTKYFEGFMLGDGYISNRNKSKYSAQFILTNKYISYVHHVSKLVHAENINHMVKVNDKKGSFKGSGFTSTLYTKFYVTFTELEKRWYKTRDDGTHFKTIPNDLKLTSNTLLHWYLGDGYLVNLKGNPVRVQFCTERYTDDEIVFLQELFKRDFGLDIQVDWNRRRLRIPKRKLRDFFNVLPSCPEDFHNDLGYKWIN